MPPPSDDQAVREEDTVSDEADLATRVAAVEATPD
jgi:hypothetical protein